MDRLSDQVCDKIEDALVRMLAFGEQVDSIDFTLAALPTPDGLMAVGILWVALKGPVLGTVLSNVDVIVDLSLTSTKEGIDASVRTSLESIRSRKAAILADAVLPHRS